jgi:hypothetical protein
MQLFDIVNHYINDRPIFTKSRKLLDLLFLMSISAFAFRNFFGPYRWLDYNDYKGIIDFFLEGHFVVPFSLFLIIYGITEFIAFVTFSLLLDIRSAKIRRKIIQYQLTHLDFYIGLKSIEKIIQPLTDIDMVPENILKGYQQIKSELSSLKLLQIEKELGNLGKNLRENFTVAIRALTALSIFKYSLPEFPWWLFNLASAIIMIWTMLIIFAYQFLNILPGILKKFTQKADEILKPKKITVLDFKAQTND